MGGSSAGWSLSSVSTNFRNGTYRPSTARQTVSGVASTSPIGPQSQVQKAIITSVAASDTPAPRPYSSGSSSMFVITSKTTNRPTTSSGALQLSTTSRLMPNGNSAAIQMPT